MLVLPNGKKVLITGGCGGIGLPLVNLLVAHDAEVTVVGRQSRRQHNEYQYIQADLSERSEIDRLALLVAQMQPDIVVNLAGVNSLTRFSHQSSESIDRMMVVNLIAPMQITRAALPSMEAQKSGHIVNVGSVLGAIGAPLMASYCASKAGLRVFSESLRRETAGTGITVTHVNPRAVNSAMNDGAIAHMNKSTGTVEDEPEKVARVIYKAMVDDRKEVSIGFPERIYMRLNAVAPVFVDDALIADRHVGERIVDRQFAAQTGGAIK